MKTTNYGSRGTQYTMVVVDHFCYQPWKRTLAPRGSFRTPHRERLKAGNAIMSMMFESTAIILCWRLVIIYSIDLLIKWLLFKLDNVFCHLDLSSTGDWVVFQSVYLAIETRYQNIPVMAVWRRQWKRHVLVAFLNAIPLALWSSGNHLDAMYY